MPHFRRKTSHRPEPRPTASWLVTGLTIAHEIKYGRRETHLMPVKPNHHRKRFYQGQRLSVRAYVGGPTECHVTVTSAQRVQLRDVDYPVVRELGYVRVDDFRLAWVAEHDPAHEGDALERFDRRHAHKEVWLLRFAVERALPPRLLAERSDELYVENPARALRDEMPALTEDEWKLHIAPDAKDREHARQAMLTADREAKSTSWRAGAARAEATMKGLDMRDEFRRLYRLQAQERHCEALRQLELIESRVFPRRMAA